MFEVQILYNSGVLISPSHFKNKYVKQTNCLPTLFKNFFMEYNFVSLLLLRFLWTWLFLFLSMNIFFIDCINLFPVWLQNQLISAGLEPHTEKSCIASYYRQFSTNMKIKVTNLKSLVFSLAFVPSGFKSFYFNIREKLSMIRCDK